MIRLTFCRSIVESLFSMMLPSETSFYKLYIYSKRDRAVRKAISETFDIVGKREHLLRDDKYGALVKYIIEKIGLAVAQTDQARRKFKKYQYKHGFQDRLKKTRKFVDVLISTQK